MDVRAADPTPVPEHAGTVTAYFMYGKDELHEATLGSHLEFINEFTIEPGIKIEPHYHDSVEFYYVLDGEGWMQIEAEKQHVKPGDLVLIPRNATHSLWSSIEGQGMRLFCFAATFEGLGGKYHASSLPDLD